MTTDQIKQELRRSALEDKDCFHNVNWPAFNTACQYKHQEKELLGVCSGIQARMFYLLVAEAI